MKLDASGRMIYSTIQERLRASCVVNNDTSCWEWVRKVNKDGYGMISVNHKYKLAHRVAYSIWVGALQQKENVLHRCDNPSCINPEHLFTGTQADNISDMIAKGRANLSGLQKGRRQYSMSPPERKRHDLR